MLNVADGSFLGSVVCVEQDGVCILDTYILVEEARGKGIGRVLWKYALNRRNKDLVLILRAVPEMVERYMSTDLPYRGNDQYLFVTTAAKLRTIVRCIDVSPGCSKRVFKKADEMTAAEFECLLKFDCRVSGRNRKRFLVELFKQAHFIAGVLLDEQGNVGAYSAIVRTMGENTYRVAPLYATCLEDVSLLLNRLLNEVPENSEIHTYFIENTCGFTEFAPIFEKFGEKREHLGTTLHSQPYQNPTNTDMVYVAHDNFLHFDL